MTTAVPSVHRCPRRVWRDRRVVASVALSLGVLYASEPGRASPSPNGQRPIFRVTLLGTGNPRPSLDRFGPATLVEAGDMRVLVDAGRGATERLFQIDGGPLLRATSTVLLTHLHSDHLVGLADVWLTGWLFGRATPIELVGPAGTRDMASNLVRAFAFDVRMRTTDEGLAPDGARIEARDVMPGVVLRRGGLTVTAFAVAHGPVDPAFGYRFDLDGRSLVISGDTTAIDALVEHARGADVLVHEVVSPEVERRRAAMLDEAAIERVIARHATPEECGRLFAKIRPRLAVYSHIVPSVATADDLVAPTRRAYDGPLAVGHDLMTITIGERIEVGTRDAKAR